MAELPAVRAECLPELELGRIKAVLGGGWNLAAFTPTGSVLLAVLDAGGASIELVDGAPAGWGRGRRGGARGAGAAESQAEGEGAGAVRTAWGAPPGRRIAAMGLVPGPDGELLRMSCGLVLRLPAAAIEDPATVAPMLAWHSAMHAAERRGLPAASQLAAAIERLDRAFGIPRRPAGRVAWAANLAKQVSAEIGIEPDQLA